jgi:hypothetical protein
MFTQAKIPMVRLADGTVAIPPILIGSHASLIRGLGALALAAAMINSLSLQLNLRHRTETDGYELLAAAMAGRQRRASSRGLSENILFPTQQV